MDRDLEFRNIGISVFSKRLNDYLGTNSPTSFQRDFLDDLFILFPDFIKKGKVYRASRVKNNFSREFRNKLVSGCDSLINVKKFIAKRYDKGYKYILESKEEIEYLDLCAVIEHMNTTYGKCITEFYQDENEILFKFSFPYDWFNVIGI